MLYVYLKKETTYSFIMYWMHIHVKAAQLSQFGAALH